MILVLGGARSGKSTFAEEKALELQRTLDAQVLYIATAIAFDQSMKDRIRKHQEQRERYHWYTLEQYKDFEKLSNNETFQQCEVILMDCMTLMVSNLLLTYPGDFDEISCEEIDRLEKTIIQEVEIFVSLCQKENKQLIIVSNEVGLGIVPAYRLGSIFRDVAGRINQKLAKNANEVFLMTAGISLRLK